MKFIVPHPKNVDGDFFVESGCCMACDLPKSVAPDLFEYEDHHCYVCKQPSQKEELDRVLNALEIQDLNCIRYIGNDPKILLEIKNRDLESCIVNPKEIDSKC
jgi:ferredoxin